MAKQSRMGTDPLGWIQDSRKEIPKDPPAKSENLQQLQKISTDCKRATFIVKKDLLEKLKDFAYWERKTIKDIINDCLEDHLKNKKVKPRPKKYE